MTVQFQLVRETRNHLVYVQEVAATEQGLWIENKMYIPKTTFTDRVPSKLIFEVTT